jgi:SAM-dependent methyltransferase
MSDLAAAVAERYRDASRPTRGFIRGKLRGDPAVAALLALGSERNFGDLLDLGCGRGQMALALLLAGAARSVAGLDLDAAKIAAAQAAAAGLPARFAVADIAAATIPPCDTIVMVDVLLQLPQPAQDALLQRIAVAAPGRVLIRAFDPERGWRSAVGFAMERIRRRLGADLGLRGSLAPRPLREVAVPLAAAGYRIDVAPCWAGTPLPNVLLVAERR